MQVGKRELSKGKSEPTKENKVRTEINSHYHSVGQPDKVFGRQAGGMLRGTLTPSGCQYFMSIRVMSSLQGFPVVHIDVCT